MLTGKEALFKLKLTQVQDGSVLGISFSHGLSGLQKLLCLCTQALPDGDVTPRKGVCQALCNSPSAIGRWRVDDGL